MGDERIRNSSLGSGPSQFGFCVRPGPTSCYTSWKAAELKQFVLNYCIFLCDGSLLISILRVLHCYMLIVDIYSRANLGDNDLDKFSRSMVKFLCLFDRELIYFDQCRVWFSKPTLHLSCTFEKMPNAVN